MGHFKRQEFACQCGCGFDTVDVETLKICEEVRDMLGEPVSIGSGCRCAEHNASIGGAKKSQHAMARAADLHVSDPQRVYSYLCAKYPTKYGFGIYDWGVHVDTRTNGPARWDQTIGNL